MATKRSSGARPISGAADDRIRPAPIIRPSSHARSHSCSRRRGADERFGDIALVGSGAGTAAAGLPPPPRRRRRVRTRRHARNRRAAEASIRRAVHALLSWRSGTRINGADLAKPWSIAKRAALRTMRDRAAISLTAHKTSRESVPAEATIPDAIRLRRGPARPRKGIMFTPNLGVNDVNERPRRRPPEPLCSPCRRCQLRCV